MNEEGKKDYRIRLNDEQLQRIASLFRGKNPVGCSYDGPCPNKIRHLSVLGLELCACSEVYIRNFGCAGRSDFHFI